MAEVNSALEKTKNSATHSRRGKQTCANPSFSTFDIFCVLFSLGTFVADLSTDIIVVVEYSQCGYIGWAVSTLLLMLLPASVVQLFSLRWHKLDEQITTSHYIFHACLLGIAQRYYIVLRTGLEARSSGDPQDFQRLYQQQSDLCMLHLFDSFMESAPQLILQLYVMLNVGDWHSWTGLSASASLCSLAWAIAAYTRAMRRARPDKKHVGWPALVLQATWRGGMLAARISAMLLFALAFHYWLLLVMGLHWIAMTTWVVLQDTDFCPTVWEERIYNGIVGVIYCFSFFNICEGRSRKKVFAFYLVVVTQNVACLILVVSLNLVESSQVVIVTAVLIIGGTVVGLCSMALYYIKFHPAGPIPCCPLFGDIETDTKETADADNKTSTLRSLKHMWTMERGCSLTQFEGVSLKSSPQSDDGCTDKKLLLENWIARSGSPTFASVPISQDPENNLDDVEFHSVKSSPDKSYVRGIVNEGYRTSDMEKLNNEKQKRRGICSTVELLGNLSEFDKESVDISPEKSSFTLQKKRRGICSSDQLILEEEKEQENLNLKIESEPKEIKDLDDDVKLKRRPIYSVSSSNNFSSELKNLYNVKLIKLTSFDDKSTCSSATQKPEEYMEVGSEVLSAHDYENICAVNIARERWGLRSWEGYTDIETFLHDDSTVRDRRRDTLTSTVTGTSSEISSSDTVGSPTLLPRKPRLRSRQDDYLDTLIYDLVDCDKRRVHFVECNDEYEVESNVFIAKPYVVDQHGMMFPLGTTLEPIEELEEPMTPDKSNKMRRAQSALVATIDEIRRGNDTDSPRHVYHRTENVWDDDVNNVTDFQTVNIGVPKSIAKALWKDCMTVTSPEKEMTTSNPPNVTKAVNISPSNIQKSFSPNEYYFKKQDVSKSVITKSKNEGIDEEILSVKKLTAISPFALNKSNTEIKTISPKKNNVDDQSKCNKRTGNKPRRKFSLLREKFEPKSKKDEENVLNNDMGSTVNLIDDLKCARYTAPVITKSVHWNNVILNHDTNDCDGQLSISDQDNECIDRSPLSSLKEKRNIFLKQVLSPPKFNNRNKRLSPNAKDINSKKQCDSL